jgi:hypothetical protein
MELNLSIGWTDLADWDCIFDTTRVTGRRYVPARRTSCLTFRSGLLRRCGQAGSKQNEDDRGRSDKDTGEVVLDSHCSTELEQRNVPLMRQQRSTSACTR